ncbi:hypothetical protein [Streptomyces sp. NPDC052107]|uniref:hypothetical protein n=1 Tax=Streptomyces sp. NPDC052107 TaxID=3155632 RepID=UPI0034312D73
MANTRDIVMNLGDPFYPLAHGDAAARQLSPTDVVARLLAYTLFAERVHVATRYVLSGGVLYEALRLAPQLLDTGLVSVDRYEGVDSFEDLARNHGGYSSDALPRAVWLDEHAAAVRSFRPSSQGAVFHALIMEDLGPGGALRLHIRGGQRGAAAARLDRIREQYATCPADIRERLVDVAAIHLPAHTTLFRRWAAMRYYLVPTLFDPPHLIRELPKSAVSLAGRADAPVNGRWTAPLDAGSPVEPFLHYLVQVPALARHDHPDAARQVIDTVLSVREGRRDARLSFSRTLDDASPDATDLRDVLRREMARQHRVTAHSSRRARSMQWIGVGIGLGSTAAGLGMSPELSTLLGLATTIAPAAVDGVIAHIQDRKRPWVLAYEEITQALSKPMFQQPT